MRRLLREAVAYSAASGVGLLVDLSLLWFLVERLGWHYLLAATASFVAGTVVVYGLSVTLVFEHRRIDDRQKEFGLFALIGVLGVIVNLVVIKTAVEVFSLHYLLAKFVSIGFTFSLNFGLRRTLLFSIRGNE